MHKIENGEVHVWQIDLDDTTLKLNQKDLLNKYLPNRNLPNNERDKASSFSFDYLRSRYLSSRIVLRDILGRYLFKPPMDIQFIYSEFNKPKVLQNEILKKEIGGFLEFNLSHSEHFMVVAVGLDLKLGIDIEKHRNFDFSEEFLDLVLTKNEKSELISTPISDRNQVFYRIWTQKEALLKAIGTGLTDSLSEVDHSAPEYSDFEQMELKIAADYSSYLVGSQPIKNVSFHNWCL